MADLYQVEKQVLSCIGFFDLFFSLLFGQSHILLFWQENLSLQIEK